MLRKVVHKLSKIREKYPNDDSAYKALGNILDKGNFSAPFEKAIRVAMGDAEYNF